MLGGVFNDRCPATNPSLGTSGNYRYRVSACQAPNLNFVPALDRLNTPSLDLRWPACHDSIIGIETLIVKGLKPAPALAFSVAVATPTHSYGAAAATQTTSPS